MFKREAKFMFFLLVTPIVLGFIGAVVGPKLFRAACRNTINEEISSPDRQNKIVIFTRDCGATTGYSTQVSLLAREDNLKNNSGNIFIADTDLGNAPAGAAGGPIMMATWEGNDKIKVEYDGEARIFKAEKEHHGIRINYLKNQQKAVNKAIEADRE